MTIVELHDTDGLAWSEQQARLVRKHADREPTTETPNWRNIFEDLKSVGHGQLSAVKWQLAQALVHDLKCESWPRSPFVPLWRAEARGFRGDAVETFTPAMRHRIDVDELYLRALARLSDTMDGEPPVPVPATCPMALNKHHVCRI